MSTAVQWVTRTLFTGLLGPLLSMVIQGRLLADPLARVATDGHGRQGGAAVGSRWGCAVGEASVTAPSGDGRPAGQVGHGRLRASHADRERVIAVVKAAFVQGRLTKDEFDARVSQSLTARTYADLAAPTADLPRGLIGARPLHNLVRGPARPSRSKTAKLGVGMIIAVAASISLAGIASVPLSSPRFTSSASVLLGPPSMSAMATQVVIAGSDPVLQEALLRVKPAMSLPGLRRDIQVTSVTQRVLKISARGETAAGAERTANAVADSYVNYVNSGRAPAGRGQAYILDVAGTATETPLPVPLLFSGGLAVLLGLLIAATTAIARGRRGRRFRMQ